MTDKSRYAVVGSDGVVQNVIIVGDQTTTVVPDFDGVASIGYTWNGTAFISPPAPAAPATAPAGPIEEM